MKFSAVSHLLQPLSDQQFNELMQSGQLGEGFSVEESVSLGEVELGHIIAVPQPAVGHGSDGDPHMDPVTATHRPRGRRRED
jgi:hypothetical protein